MDSQEASCDRDCRCSDQTATSVGEGASYYGIFGSRDAAGARPPVASTSKQSPTLPLLPTGKQNLVYVHL